MTERDDRARIQVTLCAFKPRATTSIKRILPTLVTAIAFAHGSVVLCSPSAESYNSRLGNGINFGNALEAPEEGSWGVTLQPEYFKTIKDAGFKHVRIPVCWSAHALTTEPYTIDERFINRIDWALKQARDNSLAVVLNMHHYRELEQSPEKETARFLAIWRQIGERFKDAPQEVAFEIYNEPSALLTPEKWNQLFPQVLAEIRKTNPHRTVIIGPAGWNAIGNLDKLRLPESDKDIIVTVHYYEPFHFTHQGASWAGSESKSWVGTKWTNSKEEQSTIEHDFDIASNWGKSEHRPIYLGEFGSIDQADMKSRELWTTAVRNEANDRNFSSAYWEFCASFGAYDAVKKVWQLPLLRALIGSR